MPLGPIITEDVKDLIRKFHRRHRTWTAKTIQKKVSEQWHREHPEYPTGWPSLSAIQSHLKKIKDQEKGRTDESKKLDEPWTFGSLAEYPIAPEAMPLVISIYDKCARGSGFSEGWMPSIREMLWAERLYKIIEFYKNKTQHVPPDVKDEIFDRIMQAHKNGDQELIKKLRAIEEGSENPNLEFASYFGLKVEEIPLEDIVLEWASEYAGYEELAEEEGKAFDSTEAQLDGDLMRDVYERYGERRQNFIEDLEEEYSVDVDKLIELNVSLGEIEYAAQRYANNKFQCRIFYVPKTEDSILEEARELKIGGFHSGLVILEPNKDVPDKLLHKMEKYEVNIKKEIKQ